MKLKVIGELMLTVLLISMLTVAFNFQSVKEETIKRTNLVVLEFDFPSVVVTEGAVYDSVEMLGLPQYGGPGEPILPFKTAKVLIPEGKDVQSVDVTASNRKVLKGIFNVEYGKISIPFSSNATFEDQPNQTIYGSADPFPGVLFSQVTEQCFRGYKILMLKLHPVQYIPKTGELSYFERMTIIVNTKVSSNLSPLFRNLQQDREFVLDIVDNPSEVESYTQTAKFVQSASLVNHSESYEYVIITNNALKSSFQPLVDWKIQKGLNATIVLVEDIMNDPDYHCDGLFGDGYGAKFNDTQAHVRNFIKDAYINWGTEYVLLGGDDEIIPARGVYVYTSGYYLGNGETDYNMPCDMYYGALDGSWDNDNDAILGEGVCHHASEGPENGTAGEEADFFAEVYIGRATVDTAQEATNFVMKTLAYEQDPNASYLKKALMIGQTLDAETEGGNGEDLVTDIIPQYTTTKLYSRDGTFSRSAVINEMNSGTHIVSNDGHANYATVMGLYRSDVDSLTNTEYFMAYSIGCYSAAFDSATSGTGEAIGEHFITSNGGAFAYIGNSRYGLYLPGSTDGPGDQYERSFFNVLNGGTRNIGKALQLSKENLFDEFLDRWTYFTLNLLGDPETEIVTNITAPTAHFETRINLLSPPHYGETVSLRGTAKRGTATGSTFSNYTIEFGIGTNPTFWSSTGVNLTNNGESEVVNGVLGIWNTSLVDDGTYTLRLTVSDADGNVGEDWAVIIISHQYTLTIYSVPTGITFTVNGVSHTTPWSGIYNRGTSVNLVMPETHNTGNARYYWDQWSDAVTSRSRTVTMNTNITLTAYYTGPYYQLTVTSSLITGITFTIDGVPQTTPYTELLPEGSYTFEMPETHTVGEAKYYWNQWSDGVTNRSRIVTVDTEVTLTGDFAGPYYELTVASSPITGIAFTIDGVPRTTPYTEWLPEGSYILTMPETHDGYVWSHWLEDEDTNRIKNVTLPGTTWTAVYTPANKPDLSAVWIWLAILLPLAATIIFIKLKKKKK